DADQPTASGAGLYPRYRLGLQPYGGFGRDSVPAVALDEILKVAKRLAGFPNSGSYWVDWGMLAPARCFDLPDPQVRACFRARRQTGPDQDGSWFREHSENGWLLYDPREEHRFSSPLAPRAQRMRRLDDRSFLTAIVEIDVNRSTPAKPEEFGEFWQQL